MIKLFLGIAIVAFATWCGRLLAKRYRQRALFFRQLNEFNERFLSEVSYYRRPIKDFMAAHTYQGEFDVLLKDFFYCLKENSLATYLLEDDERYLFLKDEERKVMIDYFSMLGKGDSTSQKGYFTSMKGTLGKWRDASENEAKKYGDLYIKIGFLCGLLLLILMV